MVTMTTFRGRYLLDGHRGQLIVAFAQRRTMSKRWSAWIVRRNASPRSGSSNIAPPGLRSDYRA
jgi:hypothetical protein